MASHTISAKQFAYSISKLRNFMQCNVMYYVYLIDLYPLGLFRANKTNYRDKLNRLRILTGRKQTSWLGKSATKELNQGLLETNPGGG